MVDSRCQRKSDAVTRVVHTSPLRNLRMSIPPIVRAGLQSGSIMTVADVLTQLGVERCPELDHRRTLRWTLGGLCLHGPYFFKAFQILDKTLGPATSLKVVAQKTAM